MTMTQTSENKTALTWAVPAELGIPPDPLRLRLDFHYQAIVMTDFEGDKTSTQVVSALDIANALTNHLGVGTGLLPENCLWWRNTRLGPVYAIYVEPHIQKLAIQVDISKPAKRFKIPLPGLIFLCIPSRPPWVYAVAKRPNNDLEPVFKAPLLNTYANGSTCGGNNKYPADIPGIIESFFVSFFSNAAEISGRSRKHPHSIADLWKELDGKTEFPMDDLISHGFVRDLIKMEMG